MRGVRGVRGVILAAGTGSRLGELTRGAPKGMLPVLGRPLIAWQMDALRAAGIEDIAVVTGHAAERVEAPGATIFHNPDYASTNMVHTLLRAREFLAGDVLVSYADILYEPGLARAVAASPADAAVAADKAWQRYWTTRFGHAETDLETLDVALDGRITGLGRPAESSQGLLHRYVGLVKFSARGIRALERAYADQETSGAPWPQSGKAPRQGYMTDVLHALIGQDLDVAAVPVVNGWMEFDTPRDLALAEDLVDQGRLGRLLGCNPAERRAARDLAAHDFAPHDEDYRHRFVHARRLQLAGTALDAESRVESADRHGAAALLRPLAQGFRPWPDPPSPQVLDTAAFLAACLLAQCDGRALSPNQSRLTDALQQRFEAGKVLAANHGPDGRHGFGPILDPEPWALLAGVLLLRHLDTGSWNDLNTVLKLDDALLNAPWFDEARRDQRLMRAPAAEAAVLGRALEGGYVR